MTIARAAMLGVAGASVLLACTVTRSLDYLTNGGPDGGVGLPETSSSSGGEGGVGSERVAPDQFNPRNLSQDADNLYWSNGDGAIMTASKSGGAARKLGAAPAGAPITWLAPAPGAGGDLFLIAGDGVFRVAKAGGELVPFESDKPKALALAVDDTAVFVAHSDPNAAELGHIARFDTTGGSRAYLSVEGDDPQALALEGSSVFWLGTDAEGTGVVFELPKTAPNDAGAGATAHKATNGVFTESPRTFAVDKDAIYYLDEGAFVRLARNAGTSSPATVFQVPTESKPNVAALDAQFLYIVDERASGSILRVAKTGGIPDVIAANLQAPTSVVVDDRAVYFAIQGSATGPDGAILKVSK